MRIINLIAIHCAATPPKADIGRAEIDAMHKERGWSGIGYHYVIRRDGTEEIGRLLEQVGAHAKGHNENSVGICLVGGVDEKGNPDFNFTHIQMTVLSKRVNILKAEHPIEDVCGHRDLPDVKKACPCFDVRSWFRK